MVALYANENFPLQVVGALRQLGHDVLTSQEAGQANRAIDEDVLAFATEQERALLTINERDFMRLHRRDAAHAGIFLCSQDVDVQGQAERIHQAILESGNLRGQAIHIHRQEK